MNEQHDDARNDIGIQKPILFLFVTCYILLINIAYVYYISPEYAYQKLIYVAPGDLSLLFFYLVSVLPLIILPTVVERPSIIIIWILYLVLFVPICYIPFYSQSVSFLDGMLNISVIFISLVILLLFTKIPRLSFSQANLSRSTINKILILLFVLCFLMLISQFKHIMGFTSLIEVYSQRGTFVNNTNHGGIYRYLIQWFGGLLCPFLIAYGLVYKRHIAWIFGFIGTVVVFCIAAFKSYLLQAAIMPFVVLFLNKTRFKLTSLLFAILLAIALCLIVDELINKPFVTNLLVRRVFVIPAFLTGKYWGFFDQHPFSNFSDSLLKFFFTKQYPGGIPFSVGDWILGKKFDADVNIFGSAYAELGNLGVIFTTTLLGIYLWLYDSFTYKYELSFSMVLAIVMVFKFTESSFTVCMITGGGVLLFLLFYLCYGVLNSEK